MDFDNVTKSDGSYDRGVLFSAPTSATICIRRSSRAAGFPAIRAEAADSFSDASSSASALMMRARFRGWPPPASHHLLHGLGQLHVLHLEPFDFDSPGFRGRRHAGAQQTVDFVALLKDLVQIVLPDNISQAGQRQLIDGDGRFATAITDLAASVIRYQRTALTRMVTLSRVMVSCCSAETVRVRMSMITAARCRGGRSKTGGPRSPLYLPRRK